MTYKEYLDSEVKNISFNLTLSDDLNEDDIERYYNQIRKELRDREYTIQNNKSVQC